MEPQASKGTNWLSWLFGGVIALIGIGFLFVLLTPLSYSPCEKPRLPQCISNLKQLGIGFAMYLYDYDERFPPLREWNQRILIYVKKQDIFYCPSGSRGDAKSYYAAFAPLQLRLIEQIPEPLTTPLVYDSIRMKPSPYDQLLSLPEPGRHQGGNHVAYVDGHAKQRLNPTIHEQGLKAFLELMGEAPKDPAAQGSK